MKAWDFPLIQLLNLIALKAEIDQLVYKLYNLTPEEITIVEGANG